MADEQKKLHPDCWKRKRALSSASATATSQAGGLPHPLPHTPTHRLQHPFSFLTAAGGADHRYTGSRYPDHKFWNLDRDSNLLDL